MDFLATLMLHLGFHEDWVRLVMKCVASISYTVGENGSVSDLFFPSRGLHQGDPISPYLFLICAEWFLTILNEAKVAGRMRCIHWKGETCDKPPFLCR